MKRNTRGFTLMEMLIVVAIIAVLVAIAIPVFTGQLEKSRESVDFANVRSAYAEVMVAAMSDDAGSPLKKADGTFQAEIPLKQQQEGWQTDGVENMQIGNVPYDEWDSKMPAIDGTATVTYHPDSGKVIIDWGGSGSGSGGGSGSGSGGGSGSGSGSMPALHGTVNKSERSTFTRGAVIQDATGTCVILQGVENAWTAYSSGATVAQLTSQFSSDAVSVNASNIKDSSSKTLQAGDICFDSDKNQFYYVDKVSLYEPRPNGSWVPLLQ
ncbi:MAG: prepilin-type N-terminal cleavage/methylation domain-containing protein [Eggerthellaceae bacterium]|nr:prepilin-type N-terminal cleavage/methylation domain-containing protein [Eggerthellaceae bacterium]